jgi:hypothetical protein
MFVPSLSWYIERFYSSDMQMAQKWRFSRTTAVQINRGASKTALYQKNGSLFLSFPHICLEPVLVK